MSDRQARYANIQSSLASGDLRSRWVLYSALSLFSFRLTSSTSLAGIMASDNVAEQPSVSTSVRRTGTGSNSPARGRGGSRGRRR